MTYYIAGFWKDDEFYNLMDYLSQKSYYIYFYYWSQSEQKSKVPQVTAEELKKFLFEDKVKYSCTYFSSEPLDELFAKEFSNDDGICISNEIWRNREIICVHNPLHFYNSAISSNLLLQYLMQFCSEYIVAGNVVKKKRTFLQTCAGCSGIQQTKSVMILRFYYNIKFNSEV